MSNTVTLREIGAATQVELQSIADDFERITYDEFLASILSKFRQLHAGYFSSESGPQGGWAPLRPSTIARKEHSRILFETGRLQNSLTSGNSDSIAEIEPRRLTYGTKTPYSQFHMTGTQHMPARVHVGLRDEETDAIAELVADETVRQLKRN